MKQKKTGIFGGTFNPIHYGHLIPLMFAAEARKYEKVVFVPNNISPFKVGIDVPSTEHRMNMTKLAIKDFPLFTVSDYEAARGGVSYTIDTVKYFKEQFGHIELILGQDTFAGFHSFKDPEGILNTCDVVVLKRNFIDTEYSEYHSTGKVIQINTPFIEISSTFIRERMQSRLPVTFLLPPAVEEYIKANGLYI